MKKLRKRLLLVAFIIFNAVVILCTAFSEFKDGGDAARLQDVQLHWWLIIPAALLFVLAAWSEIYKYYLVMIKSHSEPAVPKNPEKSKTVKTLEEAAKSLNLDKPPILERLHLFKPESRRAWKIATRTVLLGRYYDNITPAAVGGQPFQIYFMHTQGVKHGYDAVIPLIGMISDQLGFLIIGVISIVLGGLFGGIWSPAIIAVGWIGLLCYAFFPVIILAATFLPKTTEEVLGIVIKFLAKLHIIKNREQTLNKVKKNVEDYSSAMRSVFKIPGLFAKTLGLGIIYYVALSLIPFFVLTAFGADINIFACFATTVAVSAAIYFIPTPGNSGAAEGAFYTIFSVLPSAGYVFWAMLLWRFFVYYLWLILGLIQQFKIYTEDRALMQSWKASTDKLLEEPKP